MKLLFSVTVVALVFTLSSCYKGESVDLVIHNARVHVMDDLSSVEDAIAIKDGKIVEVGPERKILNKYSAEEYIDAQLKDVYPGFTDAHGHILSYAKQMLSVNLVGCKSYDEMIVRIEMYQGKHQRKFIIGRGWDQSLWEEGTLPTNERLNEEFPDIPVCLFRIDGHALLANDYLIEKSDVLKKFHEDPELFNGGHIEYLPERGLSFVFSGDDVETAKTPSGVFVDNAMNPIVEMIPDFPKKELTEAIMEVQGELLAYGITGVHEAGMTNSELNLFNELVDQEKLDLNVYGMLLPTEKNIAFARKNNVFTNKNFVVRSFKVYGDGALGSRGAFLKHSYADRHDHHGYLTTSREHMQEIADVCLDVGYQMNTHAIGDSANRVMLELYQDIFSIKPDHRWRIEHAQVVDPNDFKLFADAGVFPSVQPTHAISDQRWAEDRIGKERMSGAYAYKSLLDQFGMIAVGTDFPVEETDPFRTIHAAVNRKNKENFPSGGFLPDEAITLDQCIRGMTIWAAMASFQENTQGTLEKGKDATVVIFDLPVDAPPSFKNNFAYTVFIKGKKVYSVE